MLQFRRSVPLVRRNETSVQFGVDDPVLLDGLAPGDLALLDALCRGCAEAEFAETAERSGVSGERAAALLRLLREADVIEPRGAAGRSGIPRDFAEAYAAACGKEASAAAARISAPRIFALGQAAEAHARILTAAGFAVEVCESAAAAARAGAGAALTVLSSLHTHDISEASALFADDAWHLSVRIGDRRAELVPVRPGAGPCAVCAVLRSRDDGPGWFEAWTQLSQRSAGALVDPLLVEAACLESARMLRELRVHGRGFDRIATIDGRDGTVSHRPARFHHDCDCRIPLSPSGAPAPAPGAPLRIAPA